MLIDDKKILDSVYKQAVGYNFDEEVVEYSSEGEILKRKVTTKHIPPDLAALRIYMELNDKSKNLSSMTDEELVKEKQRLLEELGKHKENKQTENVETNPD